MDFFPPFFSAGLDSSNTPERKPLGFPSSHEPNVTLSQKTIIPIPGKNGFLYVLRIVENDAPLNHEGHEGPKSILNFLATPKIIGILAGNNILVDIILLCLATVSAFKHSTVKLGPGS